MFIIIAQDKKTHARTGEFHTDHGVVQTPAYMPVGTQATVKTLDVRDLHEIDPSIILANTYHLHLRPTEDLVASAGGVHKFMGWDRPVLTDSGGFQVWSLSQKTREGKSLVKLDEDGVTFRSHIDGSEHRFTPERAIIIQQKIGADIIMAFDQCTGDSATLEQARTAMELTHRWAQRCIDAHQASGVHPWKQFLFGIVQGARHEELRRESARVIDSLPFDGIAIGGESVGYFMDATIDIIRYVREEVAPHKPRYTMGVGASPLDMLTVVEQGIDMFDCVAPTRMARNGGLFVKSAGASAKHRVNILNAQFREDFSPLCTWCQCRYCKGVEGEAPLTRAYLNHLFKTDEVLGLRVASYHNVFFLQQLMRDVRGTIVDGSFSSLLEEWQQ